MAAVSSRRATAKRGKFPDSPDNGPGDATDTGNGVREIQIMSQRANGAVGALYLERQGLKRFAGATVEGPALPQ